MCEPAVLVCVFVTLILCKLEAAFEDAPEEIDVTIFNPRGTNGTAISAAAADLVEKVGFIPACGPAFTYT